MLAPSPQCCNWQSCCIAAGHDELSSKAALSCSCAAVEYGSNLLHCVGVTVPALCTLAPLTAPAAGSALPAKVVAMGAPAKIVAVSCLAMLYCLLRSRTAELLPPQGPAPLAIVALYAAQPLD